MRAIVIDGYGGVDQLHLRELPDPRPQADEDLCSLATGLLETLRGASAIGITANHIGVLKRLAVIEPGRRLRCANSVSMRAGDGELPIGAGLRLTSTGHTLRKGQAWNMHKAALNGSSHYALPAILRWFTANIGVRHG
jgi:hypothetical protein